MKTKRGSTLTRRETQVLKSLGADIALARGRRNISVTDMHKRTGLSRVTINRIEAGDAGVSIGKYLMVLRILGLEDGFSKVASDDVMGRKIQDIEHNRAAKNLDLTGYR